MSAAAGCLRGCMLLSSTARMHGQTASTHVENSLFTFGLARKACNLDWPIPPLLTPRASPTGLIAAASTTRQRASKTRQLTMSIFLVAGAPTEYSGYATCGDALADIPGYTYVVKMLKNCPDLDAMHNDPTQQKTFFVPSNAVSSRAHVISTHAAQCTGCCCWCMQCMQLVANSTSCRLLRSNTFSIAVRMKSWLPASALYSVIRASSLFLLCCSTSFTQSWHSSSLVAAAAAAAAAAAVVFTHRPDSATSTGH
jgi:hypothetical protein